MPDIQTRVLADVSSATKSIEGLLSKYNGRSINLNVVANDAAIKRIAAELAAITGQAKTTQKAINDIGKKTGASKAPRGNKNILESQINSYRDGMRELDKLHTKVGKRLSSLQSFYNKNASLLGPGMTGQMEKDIKAVRQFYDQVDNERKKAAKNSNRALSANKKKDVVGMLTSLNEEWGNLAGKTAARQSKYGTVVGEYTKTMAKDARVLSAELSKTEGKLRSGMQKINKLVYGEGGKYISDKKKSQLKDVREELKARLAENREIQRLLPKSGAVNDKKLARRYDEHMLNTKSAVARYQPLGSYISDANAVGARKQKEAARAQKQQLRDEAKAANDQIKLNKKIAQMRQNAAAQYNKVLSAEGRFNRNTGVGGAWEGRVGGQQTGEFRSAISQAKAYYGEIEKLNAQTKGQNVTEKQAAAYSKLNQNLSEATTRVNGLNKSYAGYVQTLNNANRAIVSYDKVGARMSDYQARYGHNLQKNQQLYDKFISLQNKANSGSFKNIGDANRQWAMFRTEARKAGVEIDTFGSKLQRTFGSRVRSATAGMGVFAIQSALRGIVDNAKEVDTAMTELRKVTFETDKTYTDFLTNAGTRSQNIGATLKDTVSATADFARLGFNIDEATKLADSALIYKNVGDDVNTVDDATKAIISTMQGLRFKIL